MAEGVDSGSAASRGGGCDAASRQRARCARSSPRLDVDAAADAEAVDEAEAEEVEEDVFADDDGEEGEELLVEAPEGFEFVSVPEESEVTFLMAEDDEEMTFDSVAAFEALQPEQIDREVILERMPVPVGEVISGKVGPAWLRSCWAAELSAAAAGWLAGGDAAQGARRGGGMTGPRT